jgi:chemotaxis signal transduction protein
VPGKTTDALSASGSTTLPAASDDLVSGLECRIGRAHIALPVDMVARVVEYRPVALPLAKKWVGGVAILDDAPLLSVALIAPPDPQVRGRVTGVLLNHPASSFGWALEIDEVFVFVRARLQARRPPAGNKVPRWISSAGTADGRQIGWLDVTTMLADLAQLAEEPR